jgi:glycolate oxidase FAD binding subunit
VLRVRPASYEEAAAALRRAAETGARVRPRGGGTKLGWGRPVGEPDVELETGALDAVLEHNEADLTAVLQAGLPLSRAQAALARAEQMLALDPPHGPGEAATIGGLVATGDSGPLRHRYGGVRDLVIGIRVALPDGTVAHSGGKVIKNVAGYDLAKLLAGSFGTLGVVLEVAVRLHPLPRTLSTALGRSSNAAALAAAASALAHEPLEADCLDVRWAGGEGAVLARFGGAAAGRQAERARERLVACGLDAETVDDDEPLWAAQRAGQRSAEGAVVRISAVQTQLAAVLGAAERAGASVVGRAAAGLFWLTLPTAEPGAVEALRVELAPAPCVLLDGPAKLRARVDPWALDGDGAFGLMRRVKERFDPAGVCNPGLFAAEL